MLKAGITACLPVMLMYQYSIDNTDMLPDHALIALWRISAVIDEHEMRMSELLRGRS